MVHDTPARREARRLKKGATALSREARTLAGIADIGDLAEKKAMKAWRFREIAQRLKEKARLEDLSVCQETLTKATQKGERREYFRWICYWRQGGKLRKVYLGSCNKLGQREALAKAKRLKAEALGLDSGYENKYKRQ